jgi:hypothetical protein
MTSDVCDVVTERIVLGEPLGELEEHARTCERCTRAVALPVELASHRADPGAGFSARIAVGARRRLVQRKRRRVATATVATTAAIALGAFAVTRSADETAPIENTAAIEMPRVDPDPATKHDDEDVRELVSLARTDRSIHLSAHWSRIEKPLAPYRALVKGVTP